MVLRKDKSPTDTIHTIQNILKAHGIAVAETNVITYGNYWSSIRLELQGIRGVGVNGKGCTLETASASAYGELMERIQNGFLINRLYKKNNSRKAHQIFSLDELLESLLNIDVDIHLLFQNYEKELIKYDYLREKARYYSIKYKCDVELPNWFIETNCGTNGLCAGNTKEEALLQGINEIQERYVRKKFFKGEIEVTNIDFANLKNLSSYKLLKLIEEKGYRCFVKDFTCGGIYPVLGLVVADSSMNNYLVSMGADYDMDICLHRCITEMFQGRDFSLLFRYKMIHAFDQNNFFVTGSPLEKSTHYQNNVLDGCGAYPFQIFNSYVSDDLYLDAFISDIKTNAGLLNVAINKLLEENRDIYVKDNSFLGFPAYRIYIKGMSELCDSSIEIIKNIDNYNKFDNLFYRIREISDNDINYLVGLVLQFLKVPFYTEENILSVLTGIPLELNWFGMDVGNIWMFCTLCSWKTQKYSMAKKYLEKFLLRYQGIKVLKPNYQVLYLMVNLMDAGKTEQEAKEACLMFDVNGFAVELISIQKEFNVYPACPNCLECRWKKECCFQSWKELKDKLKV